VEAGAVRRDFPPNDCIRRYDRKNTFFYCDPPYYKTAELGLKRVFNPIQVAL